MSSREKISMGIFALAMNAKCERVDNLDLANLMTEAEELLDRSDPLRQALVAFAVEAEVASGPDLAAACARLHWRLARGLAPDLPGSDRRDIHG